MHAVEARHGEDLKDGLAQGDDDLLEMYVLAGTYVHDQVEDKWLQNHQWRRNTYDPIGAYDLKLCTHALWSGCFFDRNGRLYE